MIEEYQRSAPEAPADLGFQFAFHSSLATDAAAAFTESVNHLSHLASRVRRRQLQTIESIQPAKLMWTSPAQRQQNSRTCKYLVSAAGELQSFMTGHLERIGCADRSESVKPRRRPSVDKTIAISLNCQAPASSPAKYLLLLLLLLHFSYTQRPPETSRHTEAPCSCRRKHVRAKLFMSTTLLPRDVTSYAAGDKLNYPTPHVNITL